MKRAVFYLSILLNIVLISVLAYSCYVESKRKDFFDFSKHGVVSRAEIGKVCFVGNSITANWSNLDEGFFSKNEFINRGTGAQSSTQILLRFQQDVISLQSPIVVLNTGINDIGEADGFYKENFTLQNIQSMIDICKTNNVTLILTSVLPATEIKKNRFTKIENIQLKIESLNQQIIKLANINNLKYVDYNSKMRKLDGSFQEKYTFDGVHPNEEGYKIMESLILETINQVVDK